MANETSRRFEKTPFALAGIPPAQPGRNAFAEQGMAQITHHLRGNAFAAQALNERAMSPLLEVHPALRPRGNSETSLCPPMHSGLPRVATPTLRDALELKEAQSRSAAAAAYRELENNDSDSTAPASAQTPSKKKVKELFTPIANWRPFNRRSSRKHRAARPSLPGAVTSLPARRKEKAYAASVMSNIPPTPPKKNTPPGPVRANTEPPATPSDEATIYIAYPGSPDIHASATYPGRPDLIVFDESTGRRDRDSQGFLPYFGLTHCVDPSPEKTSPEVSLFATSATSNEQLQTLSPVFYSHPSARPSPLQVNGETFGTDEFSCGQTSPTTPFHNAPVLRHKLGSVQDINESPGICSTINEEARSVSPLDMYPSSDSQSIASSRRLSIAEQVAQSFSHASVLKTVDDRVSELLGNNNSTSSVNDFAFQLDELAASLAARIDEVKSDVDSIKSNVSEKISDVDHKITGVKSNVDEKIQGVVSKINKVESSVDEKISEVESIVDEKIQGVDSKITGVDSKVKDVHSKIKNVDSKIDGVKSNVDDFEADYNNGAAVRAACFNDTVQEIKGITDQHIEAIAVFMKEISTAVKDNNTAISALNDKLNAADASSEAGMADVKNFHDIVTRLCTEMADIKQKVAAHDDSLYWAHTILKQIKIELANMGDSIYDVKKELEDLKHCNIAVCEMYVRCSAMTHLWDSVTTGELLPRLETAPGQTVPGQTAPGQTAPGQTAPAPRRHNSRRSRNGPSQASADPATRVVDDHHVPLNPQSFLRMMLDIQDRLASLEARQSSSSSSSSNGNQPPAN